MRTSRYISRGKVIHARICLSSFVVNAQLTLADSFEVWVDFHAWATRRRWGIQILLWVLLGPAGYRHVRHVVEIRFGILVPMLPP